jgi:hypothetical protein
MTRTPYSEDNKAFTDAAHLYAREHIYPKVFGVGADKITYAQQEDILKSETWQILDGRMAIDQVLSIKDERFRYPLSFTVQERFRKPKYKAYNDITITENNGATDAMGELYKLNCDFFLYGYYDNIKRRMLDAVFVDVPEMKRGLIQSQLLGTLDNNRQNKRTSQTMLTIKFDDLQKAGVLKWRLVPAIAIVETKAEEKPISKEGVFAWMNQLHQSKDELTLARLSRFAIDLLINLKEKAA